jgi:glyoxylase-like metal-dependent hydrolase (beta-lactamase superfamily II)
VTTPTAPVPVTEVAPGLHQLELGPDGFVNAFLIVDEGELTLFDSGFPGDGATIVAVIESLGYDRSSLKRIVLSHAHFDHSGSAAEVRELTGAPVLLSQVDAELIRSGFCSRGVKIKPEWEEFVRELLQGADISSPQPTEPFEIDGYLEPGSGVPGLADSELIATPGHCLGQVSLLLRRHGGILVAGDAAENFDAVMSPRVGEDFDTLEESFTRLSERDFEIAVFGHGPPVTSGASEVFRALRS